MVELLKENFPMVKMREKNQEKVELSGKSLEKCCTVVHGRIVERNFPDGRNERKKSGEGRIAWKKS
jgi:hypothetical protein